MQKLTHNHLSLSVLHSIFQLKYFRLRDSLNLRFAQRNLINSFRYAIFMQIAHEFNSLLKAAFSL
jgi:hypothetical protein